MKFLVQIIALFLLTGSLRALQSFPDMGSIPAEDIALSAVSLDPETEAVILRKDVIVFPDEKKAMITRHRVRMKILKDGGTQYGNIKIRHPATMKISAKPYGIDIKPVVKKRKQGCFIHLGSATDACIENRALCGVLADYFPAGTFRSQSHEF